MTTAPGPTAEHDLVWTATESNGSFPGGGVAATCVDWTSSASNAGVSGAVVGRWSDKSTWWTRYSGVDCASSIKYKLPLYCLEQ